MNDYLDLLKQTCYQPNFWCSDEYFRRAGWKVAHRPFTWCGVWDDNKLMLPAICKGLKVVTSYKVWAGFSNMDTEGKGNFLDYEFIYWPPDFLDLSGSRWKKVRKNLRWAEGDVGEPMCLVSSGEVSWLDQEVFWKAWLDSHDEEWYDAEVAVDYMVNGDNRLFLVGKKSGLIWAEVVWDENWLYVNFRYCAVLPGIRGLSDYARVTFYRWLTKHHCKLVNDGGSLGSESLYNYKMKLNPLMVGVIKTYQ